MERIPVHLRFAVSKIGDEGLVFGYANVSIAKNDGGLISDTQNDSITPEELEKAAYGFLLHSGEADAMHRGPAIGRCVESVVFTPEKLRKLATDPTTGTVDEAAHAALQKALPPRWWVGFQIDDPAAFAKVKSGEYAMFSIAGQADREPIVEKGGPGSGKPAGYGGGKGNNVPEGGHQAGDRVVVRGNGGRAAVNGEGLRGTISSSHGDFHSIRTANGETHGSFHSSDLHNLEKGGVGSGMNSKENCPFQMSVDGTPTSVHRTIADAHSAAQDAANATGKNATVVHRANGRRISEHTPMPGAQAPEAA